jgi:hypothetical protein
MPEPIVRADIEAGRLVRLNLREWRGGEYTMPAIHKIDTPPGPAGRRPIERLVTLSDTFKAPAKQVSKPTSGKGRRKSQRARRCADRGNDIWTSSIRETVSTLTI